MKILSIALLIILTGCATTESAQLGFTKSCIAYDAVFKTVLQARTDGKLNQSQIDSVTLLDSQVTPLCTGPIPSDPTKATADVTAAITTLTVYAATGVKK